MAAGLDLLNELHAAHGVYAIPFGNTTAQMGGWFRKEIKTVDDLRGLKFRVGGMAGMVLAKLGVVPQQLPPGDIYPALEKGTIDAAEWIGPYDDEKLGFLKVAPYYYFPGWWEGNANGFLYINSAKWAELPKVYQAMLTSAGAVAAGDLTAKYDAYNAQAIKRLVARRRAAAALLERNPRCVVQGDHRTLRRAFGQEREVQEAS